MPGLLSVGEMGALALHSILEIAKRCEEGDGWISVTDLADSLMASRHTLHKVTKRLVTAGLLDSSRGPAGGVRLRERPADIPLLKVIEAVDGEVGMGGCLFARRVCQPEAVCQFCDITSDLERMVHGYFATTTIADLTDRIAMDKAAAPSPEAHAAKKEKRS